MEEIKPVSKNIYAENAQAYLDAGYSVIPDKYMSKLPAIKAKLRGGLCVRRDWDGKQRICDSHFERDRSLYGRE